MSIQEVLFFSDRLAEAHMPRGAFVVNRFRKPPPRADDPPSIASATEAAAKHGLRLDDSGPERLVRAHADAVRLSRLDALHVQLLDDRAKGGVPIVRVPELATDVHDLPMLSRVAEMLMSGGV